MQAKKFQPKIFVFLLINEDITDSYSKHLVGSYFLNLHSLDLEFEPLNRNSSSGIPLKSALIRYLTLNLKFNPASIFSVFNHKQASTATASPDLNLVSTRLLEHLEQKSMARPDNTIFIIDSDREKIYQHQPQPQTAPNNQLSVFAKIAQQRGYTIVDTLPLFTRQYQKSHRQLDFKPTDGHWNEQAHKLIAETLYPIIQTKLSQPTSSHSK